MITFLPSVTKFCPICRDVMVTHGGNVIDMDDRVMCTIGDPLLDLEHYAQRSARDLSAMQWYAVLACFKLGIILDGTYARACAGKADRPLGELFHTITRALFERAQKFMEESW